MTKHLIQAYRQTPWRVQAQRLVVFAVAIVGVALIAVLYLDLAGTAANAGLEFNKLEKQKSDLTRQIEDLRAQLAVETSETKMMERAKALGFVQIAMDKVLYIVVPGYTGRVPVTTSMPAAAAPQSEPILKPSYTQSLWEWLFQGALAGAPNVGGQNQ